jgi:hypothetical protein
MAKRKKDTLKADIHSSVSLPVAKSRQFRDMLTRVTSPIVLKGKSTNAKQWNRWSV